MDVGEQSRIGRKMVQIRRGSKLGENMSILPILSLVISHLTVIRNLGVMFDYYHSICKIRPCCSYYTFYIYLYF